MFLVCSQQALAKVIYMHIKCLFWNLNAASSVEQPTFILICPLKSIIEEQITSNEFNLSSAELRFDCEALTVFRNCGIQVVYAGTQQACFLWFSVLKFPDAIVLRGLFFLFSSSSRGGFLRCCLSRLTDFSSDRTLTTFCMQ